MTIEEEFTLLRESILTHINGPEDDKPPCSACDNRIRAILVAVLEETMPPRRHSGQKKGIERRYLAIRARIAKLGNEEG